MYSSWHSEDKSEYRPTVSASCKVQNHERVSIVTGREVTGMNSILADPFWWRGKF